MDVAEIEKLAEVHGDPAVSILCRLDRRRAGNLEDPRRLDALRKEAVAAMTESYGEQQVARVSKRLETAIAGVDLAHPSESVAILATADEVHVVPLPFAVSNRVVVGDTFATGDLLNGARQMLHVRVLVLAAEHARCFDADGFRLHEILDSGFPVELSAPMQADTPRRDLPIGEKEEAEAHRFVLRAVDSALATVQSRDHRPIVVVAPVREIAYFDEVTRFENDVIARVHGNHVSDSVTRIEAVVDPALTDELDRRSQAAVHRANEAVGAGAGAATGVDAATTAASSGRGRELVIEEHLHVGAELRPRPDPIDELVEAVLAHGGQVTTVADGALADHGGAVLILRF